MRAMNMTAHKLLKVVGASGFEPEASCAQGRRTTQDNPPVFNVPTETKQLSHDGSMWLAVRKRAHLSVGWAQKLAQSRWFSGPRFVSGIVRHSHPMRDVFRPAGARAFTLFSAPFGRIHSQFVGLGLEVGV